MYRYQVVAHLLAFLMVVAVACSEAPEGPKTSAKEEVKAPAQEEEKTPVQVDKEDIKKLVEGNNEFAFDLYQRLSQEKGNVVFSPYSISNALAMTYGGARGDTAKEMAKTLHFTLPQERLHPAFGDLIAELQEEKKEKYPRYHLYIANALWGQKGYGFKDDFLRLTWKNYGAGFKEVNFGNGEEARQTINRWVEEQTKDKIKELLKPGIVDGQTRLVLTNAIYFKASWKRPFPKENTKDADFAVTLTEKVPVTMMSSDEEKFNYFEEDGCQWVELLYQGDRLAMVLLLPRKKDGLADMEKRLTAATLREGLHKLKPQMGKVSLPRFKVSTYYPLTGILGGMGMPLGGDFSGIASGLQITFVEHKAFIEVEEEGTEG